MWLSRATIARSRINQPPAALLLRRNAHLLGTAGSRPTITPRRDRHDITEPSDAADSNDPTLAMEPIEKTEAADPTDPIESTEPTEPIDSIEPFDPILKVESWERIDQREPRPSVMTSIVPQPQRPGPDAGPLFLPAFHRRSRRLPGSHSRSW
jgi:hypothetical protein